MLSIEAICSSKPLHKAMEGYVNSTWPITLIKVNSLRFAAPTVGCGTKACVMNMVLISPNRK